MSYVVSVAHDYCKHCMKDYNDKIASVCASIKRYCLLL